MKSNTNTLSFIPHIQILKKHKTLLVLGAIAFWAMIGLLVYGTELIASHYFGATFMDEIEQTQYILRWFAWLLLTPAIVFFALKINIGNSHIALFILLHLLIGTLILSLEFFIELTILKPMAEHYYQRTVSINELIIPFLNKYFGYVINYFLIVGIVNMYVYMQSLYSTRQSLLQTELQNKNLKYELAVAQIHSLKMQIQPHFLFNIHQSLLALILQKDHDKAAALLSKLSELLRVTLQKQDHEFVPLEEEIAIVNLYLDLQQVRFEDRMIYSQQLQTETLNIPVPFFILQPLVENAIRYGVEQHDTKSYIQIHTTIADHQLHIEVKNTGKLSANQQLQGFGIGLSNVVSRLKQHYGDVASLELFEDIENNTIAKIIIPVNEK